MKSVKTNRLLIFCGLLLALGKFALTMRRIELVRPNVLISPVQSDSIQSYNRESRLSKVKNPSVEGSTLTYDQWIQKGITLGSKALRTQSEEQEFEFILKNENVLDHSLRVLETNAKNDGSDRDERMKSIDYLDLVLDLQRGHLDTRLVDRVKKIILTNVLEQNLSLEGKKTLIADKIELIGRLAAVSPDETRKIELETQDLADQRAFRYARKMYGISF